MAEVDEIINQPSESEKRIKDLSGKVRDTAAERDQARTDADAAKAGEAKAQRTADFYKGFSGLVAANPSAKDHEADILAKVEGGYTVEDATFAVLGKAGKLNQPKAEEMHIAGGSSNTAIPQGGAQKPVGQMTQQEKRTALLEAEARGDIGLS